MTTLERSTSLLDTAAVVALSVLLAAGCVAPLAAPTPSQAGGASTASPAAPAASGLSCRQIVQCIGDCSDTDAACSKACSDKGSSDGNAQYRVLAACIEQEKCTEATCAQDKCAASLNACTAAGAVDGGTVAVDPAADPAADGPIVATMHAAALVREFETNIVRASELYLGKRVRVYGTVNSVSPDGDRIALVFKSSITTYSNLFCRFPQARAGGLANLHTGDEATADGTVIGLTTGRLVLDNCSTP